MRRLLYLVGRLMGDASAVRQGKVGRRIGRRVVGKVSGKAIGRMFK